MALIVTWHIHTSTHVQASGQGNRGLGEREGERERREGISSGSTSEMGLRSVIQWPSYCSASAIWRIGFVASGSPDSMLSSSTQNNNNKHAGARVLRQGQQHFPIHALNQFESEAFFCSGNEILGDMPRRAGSERRASIKHSNRGERENRQPHRDQRDV